MTVSCRASGKDRTLAFHYQRERIGLSSPCRTRSRGGIVTFVNKRKRQDFTLYNQMVSAGLTRKHYRRTRGTVQDCHSGETEEDRGLISCRTKCLKTGLSTCRSRRKVQDCHPAEPEEECMNVTLQNHRKIRGL
jgi:hypothetical protein